MNKKRTDTQRLERLLAAAWREGAGAAPGPIWQAGVMAGVRAAAGGGTPAWANGFSRLVLRMSLTAAAAAAVLVAWLVAGGLIPYEELALMMIDEPLSLLAGTPFVIL